MGTRGNIMFRYLLILCKIAEIKIIGDVITVHAFPVLSLHFFPRLYLKVNLYRTHSAVHTLCYQSVKSMFPSVREVFLFCSVTISPILYSINTHVQGVTWNVCVTYTQYLLRNICFQLCEGKRWKNLEIAKSKNVSNGIHICVAKQLREDVFSVNICTSKT